MELLYTPHSDLPGRCGECTKGVRTQMSPGCEPNHYPVRCLEIIVKKALLVKCHQKNKENSSAALQTYDFAYDMHDDKGPMRSKSPVLRVLRNNVICQESPPSYSHFYARS
ncbi:hypothetical protein AVEN_123526-1 [Araneus ventricosus]|uniref:Uncharacterized protein n=1 Tax=Araneus ventricosus TaxID=182803 RepID=A0A4Y2LIJ2_ARAVE|nr:hypothetical protein AVEN_123526-1 [Araneus ventricosus]